MTVTKYFMTSAATSSPRPTSKQSPDTITTDNAELEGLATYAAPLALSTTADSTEYTISGGSTEPGSAHYHHFGSFVSPVISAGTFTGTLTFAGVFRNDGIPNMYPKIYAYIWHNDNTKGTVLYNNYSGTAVPDSSFPASPTTYLNAVAITGFTAVATDKIAVEVETYDNTTTSGDGYYEGFAFAGADGGGYGSYISFNLTEVVASTIKPQEAAMGSANMMWI